MCLQIDTTIHKRCDIKGRILPFKTFFRRKKVYKILILSKDGTITTPYLLKKLEFNSNRIKMQSDYTSDYKEYGGLCVSGKWVDNGIHGFYDYKKAIEWIRDMQNCWHSEYSICIMEAEIPPFTKYYFGSQKDIVAERMIIKNNILESRVGIDEDESSIS